MFKGIYLGCGYAYHPDFDLVYQDINGLRDLGGDMLDIDLSNYDYILASPPCNFWSKARGNKCSQYSLNTMHLLPDILNKLIKCGKPFIVENVKNIKRFYEYKLLPRNDCYVFTINRHIYFTNCFFDLVGIEQRQDFKTHKQVIRYEDMLDPSYCQGGFNVHNVFERFLNYVNNVLAERVQKA